MSRGARRRAGAHALTVDSGPSATCIRTVATLPRRVHCATCGSLLSGPRCDACGGDAVPLPLQDAGRLFVAPEPEGGRFEKAIELWERQDHQRAFSHCLSALGLGAAARAVSFSDGPGWIISNRKVALFVALDFARGEIAIESPLVRLPQRQRVPALRLALELSGERVTSRICLRGDLLMLRFVGLLAALSPPLCVAALEEAFELSASYVDLFANAFDAHLALSVEQLSTVGWEVLGQPHSLSNLASGREAADRLAVGTPPSGPPSSLDPSVTPLPRSMPGRAGPRSTMGPIAMARMPSIRPEPLLGGLTPSRFPTLRPGAPPEPVEEDIPAILAPGLAAGWSGPNKPKGSPSEVQPDLPARRPSMMAPSGGEPPPEAERLCDLLRGAQALATALSFQERPGAMMLLVRSTVYRALFEFSESVPDAVAHLFRATADSTKEIWATESRRRGSMSTPIPMAEPALLVMQQIVSSRGQVPKEKTPPNIEPLTSAAQAKEHLKRYVEEIERAPNELPLRHFLAMGALAELLARTKLPPATQQRVRNIVSHAQTEGPKTATIELMMTALRRIIDG